MTKNSKNKNRKRNTRNIRRARKAAGRVGVGQGAGAVQHHVATGMEALQRVAEKRKTHCDTICPVASRYSKALQDPWTAPPSGKNPYSEDMVACTSNVVPRVNYKTITVKSGVSCLDLWLFPEGLWNGEDEAMKMTYVDAGSPSQKVYSGMGPTEATIPSAFGLVIQNPSDQSNTNMALPNLAIPGINSSHFLLYNDVEAQWPTDAARNGAASQHARAVGSALKVSFVGRQVDVEGTVESMCLFENPAKGQWPQFLTDRSFRTKSFGAKRDATVKWWPNCESKDWKRIEASASFGSSVRWRVKITGLQAGDKVRLDYCTNYELQRPQSLAMETPAPMTGDIPAVGNAIRTYHGSNATLAQHILAEKVVRHPQLRDLPGMEKAVIVVDDEHERGKEASWVGKTIDTLLRTGTRVATDLLIGMIAAA